MLPHSGGLSAFFAQFGQDRGSHRNWILPFVSRLEGYQCETLSKEDIACLRKLLIRWNNSPDVMGYDKIMIERLLQTKFRASEA